MTGMQTLCTRELGKGDVKAFNRLFSAVMILGTGFSLVLTALLLVGAVPFAMLLGATGKGASLALPAAQYLRGVGIGLPALIMAPVLATAVNMDSGRRRVMTAAILCSVLNIVFDIGAIALHLGLFGIGLATALTQYLQIAWLLLHFSPLTSRGKLPWPSTGARPIPTESWVCRSWATWGPMSAMYTPWKITT